MSPQSGPFVPIWQVDANGGLNNVGEIAANGYGVRVRVTQAFTPRLGIGEHELHYTPFFLEALRPGGYLGALESMQIRAKLGVAQPANVWSVEKFIDVLDRYGLDQPGNLFVGQASADLIRQMLKKASPYPLQTTPEGLDGQAEQSIEERQSGRSSFPGSGSLGEQPKMLSCWAGFGNHPSLVKFSPPCNASPVARRVADLLLSEAHCMNVMADAGISAAETTSIVGQRVHLLSKRFDWTRSGRLPMAPLSGVDMDFYGEYAGISATMARLAADDLLPTTDAEAAAVVEEFSTLIGNNDRHMFNASLRYDAQGFRATPQYDVLPMRFMPVGGEIPKVVIAQSGTASQQACQLANELRTRIVADTRISDDFRHLYVRFLSDQLRLNCSQPHHKSSEETFGGM